MPNPIRYISVLKGGWSAERTVSLNSGEGVARAARELGYEVKEIDVSQDLNLFIQELTPKPDLVINMLHGRWGEDGRIQSILDILNIPYTASNHLASAIAMDKCMANRILATHNLPIPKGQEYNLADLSPETTPYPYPFVMKPPCEGSSVGVFLIFKSEDYRSALNNWEFGSRILIEEYIPGAELSTLVMGKEAVGTMELRPQSGFFDYTRKYTSGLTEHIMPAPLPADHYQKTLELASKAAQALGCTGLSRVDFRYNPQDNIRPICILEVNTQPGMSATSIAPEIAAYHGISFQGIVKWMIENAQCHA